MERNLDRYSKLAALYVSIASAVFVFVLLILIIFMGSLQSKPMDTSFVQPLIDSCPVNAVHCDIAMELIVQETRGSRAGLALYYRFAISATAIVVSLSMVVLGSVLIFDRITEGDKQPRHGEDIGNGDVVSVQESSPGDGNSVTLSYRAYSVMAKSPFPGLLLAAMGAICLMGTLWLAGPKAPQITLFDVPIYVSGNSQGAQRAGMIVGGDPVAPETSAEIDSIGALDHATE